MKVFYFDCKKILRRIIFLESLQPTLPKLIPIVLSKIATKRKKTMTQFLKTPFSHFIQKTRSKKFRVSFESFRFRPKSVFFAVPKLFWRPPKIGEKLPPEIILRVN